MREGARGTSWQQGRRPTPLLRFATLWMTAVLWVVSEHNTLAGRIHLHCLTRPCQQGVLGLQKEAGGPVSLSSEGGIAPLGKMSSAPKQTAVQKVHCASPVRRPIDVVLEFQEKGEKRTAKKKESRVKRHAMAGLQVTHVTVCSAHSRSPRVQTIPDK